MARSLQPLGNRSSFFHEGECNLELLGVTMWRQPESLRKTDKHLVLMMSFDLPDPAVAETGFILDFQ